MQTILYFHGFESNCQTEKFARCKAFFEAHGMELIGLDVNYADIAPNVIDQIVAEIFSRHDIVACIGCSLGGYWANRSAVLHLVTAAIVNPALKFYQSHLKKYPELAAYKHEAMYTESNMAPRLVMLGTADKVLDYRVAEAAFSEKEVTLVKGGSHAGYDFLDAFLQAAWLTIKQADFCGTE